MGGAAEAIGVRNLRNGLVRLRKELQMPQTLAQAGIPPGEVMAQASAIVQATLEDPCCATNPVPPNEMLVRQILGQVMGVG